MSYGEKTTSYKAEVIADDSGKWIGNGLRFATQDEAASYGSDLMWRWTAVKEVRVTTSDEPVNSTWTEKGTQPLQDA